MSLPYSTQAEIRDRLEEVCPSLVRYDLVEDANYFTQAQTLAQVGTGNTSGYMAKISVEDGKPICRLKDTDQVTFPFLLPKTGFVTYPLF